MTVRFVAAVMAVVISTACSKSNSPTAPGTPLIPEATGFEGVWTLKYKVEGCGGYRHCVLFIGQIRTVYLHLARVDDGYDGVVDLGDHVSVSGTVGPDGTLTLTGRRPAALADDMDVEIEALTLKPAGSSQSTAGSVRYMERGPSGSWFFGSGVTHGSIISAERTGSLEASPWFSGTWTGTIAIHSCEAIGWTHCYPLWNDRTYDVRLELVPGGGGVEGVLGLGGEGIPVSGAATGSRLRLSGSASPPSSGVTVTLVVEAPALTVDRVGRMTGDVTLVSTYNWHDGRGIWTVRYPPLPLYAVARSLR